MHDFSQKTVSALPLIRRARDYFLYAPDGTRYRDLYLCGGSLVFGHTPRGCGLVMKNAIEQAMLMPYPNVWHRRLLRMVSRGFSADHVWICSTRLLAQQDISWDEPWTQNPGDYMLWRPFLPRPKAKFVHLVLPAITQDISIILGTQEFSLFTDAQIITCAMQARLSIHALGLWQNIKDESSFVSMTHLKPILARHGGVFGPYFFFADDEKKYQKIYHSLLGKGLLLPPGPGLVGAIPVTLSHREEKILKEVLG